MNEMYPIIEVSLSDLHRAAYIPKCRTQPTAALERLYWSIKQHGLLLPLLVVRRADGDGYDIVDGHRRVCVANLLGWAKIPVIVSSQAVHYADGDGGDGYDIDPRALFAATHGYSPA